MNEEYRISSDHKDIDLDKVHKFISGSYWAEGIPKEILQRGIENSLCFGVFHKSEGQVGFALMITDKATFAYLADVFVLEKHRGKGLSKQLMEAIMSHPDLQGLRRMALATLDAHELYKKFGFVKLAQPELFMELWKPDVYKKFRI